MDLRGKLPVADPKWDARYGTRDLAGIFGVTYHYTAGGYSSTPHAIAAYQTSDSAVAQTGAGTPFPGLAYSLLVDGGGVAYLAHDLTVRVWHSAAVVGGKGRNYTHVGVVFTGNGEPTTAQKETLGRVHRWLERQLGRALAAEGHNWVYPTACPGPNSHAWIGAL